MYCYDVALNGIKVSYFEQNWLLGNFNKFLGIEIKDSENKMLAFTLYAKAKLLKTKKNLDEQDIFIKMVRVLQAYETDFVLHEVGRELKKCYKFFEELEKFEKEKNLDVGILEFDKNGILVGVTNNAGNTVAPKFFDFPPCELFNKCAQNQQSENEIF